MTIEQDICRRVSEAIRPLLDGIPVEGNFLGPSGSNPKGTEPYRTALARVEVSPRECAAYTAAVAEVRVRVEASLTLAADPDLSRTLAAYEAVTGLIASWHGDVRAAKAALGDAVVGVRLAGGEFDEGDGNAKARTFSQSAAVKVRCP